MRVRLQQPFPHPREQPGEGGVARQVGPHGQRVDEQADQPLRLPPRAPGDGGAHHHVLRPRVAGEQQLEGGQQQREERGSLAPRQPVQPLRRRRVQREGDRRAAEALRRRARPVRGQLQHGGRAGQPLLPERELPLQQRAAQPLALPEREVGVLDRRLRERRGAAGGKRLVERAQLAEEHLHGPAVADDVVHAEEQHVLLRAAAQQQGAQQRPRRQVEGAERGLPRPPPHLGVALRRVQAGEVLGLQAPGARRRDHLHRLPRLRRERGAQHLVAEHHLRERALQRLRPQRPAQPEGDGHVVERARRIELVQEPEPVLGEGEREARGARRLALQQPREEAALLLRAVGLPGRLSGLGEGVVAHGLNPPGPPARRAAAPPPPPTSGPARRGAAPRRPGR